MTDEITRQELCERYDGIYTAAITDVLHEHGYEEQTLDPDITPIETGVSATGIAFPIIGQPNRSVDADESLRTFLKMHEDISNNHLLMYDTNDDSSAHLGELEVSSLQPRGCNGAIIDGGIRDTSTILEKGFPVFHKYTSPVDCIFRWELLDWDVPAVVGGVEVTPGDIVVADDDGVVVVPEKIAEEILYDAEKMVDSEDKVRESLSEGMTPLEAYEKYGTF
ncbi:RraA family protein (plasmid) [Halococcus dombrowskii]|uniref:RraA family protein n=1 Tax=Halococcus dombrowskii TaxID=179637 RepID=A0AAV3SKZ5_HALDO|nr:RraA family protein [Halococcus dombrowskii]UOO96803.1 RraA family protein [Halococcus dombrowskii]